MGRLCGQGDLLAAAYGTVHDRNVNPAKIILAAGRRRLAEGIPAPFRAREDVNSLGYGMPCWTLWKTGASLPGDKREIECLHHASGSSSLPYTSLLFHLPRIHRQPSSPPT